MTTLTLQDRAQGAMVGSLIGDALALGPHWHGNLEEQKRDYGKSPQKHNVRNKGGRDFISL